MGTTFRNYGEVITGVPPNVPGGHERGPMGLNFLAVQKPDRHHTSIAEGLGVGFRV